MMKAAVIERIGYLTVKEVSEPKMGEYDALCEILYGATCAGTDLHVIEGKHPRPVSYPTILGHESVGRVIEVGAKVKNFRVGDIVSRVGAPVRDKEYSSNWGGFAEYGIAKDHWEMRKAGLPKDTWNKSRVNQVIPAQIDPRAATLIITLRETSSYIKRIGVKKGSKVLVIGSGANAIALAANAYIISGGEVTAIGSMKRQEAAKRVGIGHYIDYKSQKIDDELREICPDGYDVIIDAVGKNAMLSSKLGYLANGGTIGVYGFDDFYTNSIVLCNAIGSFYYYNEGYDEEETHEYVCELLIQKKIDPTVWINFDYPYELGDINKAYESLKRRENIKALIKIRG